MLKYTGDSVVPTVKPEWMSYTWGVGRGIETRISLSLSGTGYQLVSVDECVVAYKVLSLFVLVPTIPCSTVGRDDAVARDSFAFSRRKVEGAQQELDGARSLLIELQRQTTGLHTEVRSLEADLASINR